MTYDGFISYSHAADDLLAPRLQAGLQRFAKPWWKRRAVRIFRDESSLSANPHLWSSITEALDTSGWFVLLLSPDAAESEWVNQEIAYWVANRDPGRILPVVTAGEFGWADGDVTGDAVPDALRGVFAEEPRWVDLRFAKGEEQLDLQDPRFADAIADVGSAIRGVAKDELTGEEVRQHRRTVRTAWAVGALLLALAVVAVWAGLLSARNADEAQRQAKLADENALTAEANAVEAQESADQALANAAEAQEQRAGAEAARLQAEESALLARARELAAAAVVASASDSQLALLLVREAVGLLPAGAPIGPVVENAIRTAISSDRLLNRSDALAAESPSYMDISPDGSKLVVSVAFARRLQVLDAGTLTPIWEYSFDDQDLFGGVGFSSEGTYVYMAVEDAAYSLARQQLEGEPEGEPNARMMAFDAEDGSIIWVEELPGSCAANAVAGAWREDLALFGFGFVGCGAQGEFEGTFRFVETENWETVYERPSRDFPNVTFGGTGTTAALLSGFNSESSSVLINTQSWEILQEVDHPWGALSPDGAVFAGSSYVGEFFGIELVDIASGRVLDKLPMGSQAPWYPQFSPDGGLLAVASFGDTTFIFDVRSGELVEQLIAGATERAAFDGERLHTVWDGVVQSWDALGASEGDFGVVPLNLWVNANSIFWSGDTVVALVADRGVGSWYLYPVNPVTGELREPIPADDIWSFAPISGNRIALFRGREVEPGVYERGTLEVMDLDTGEASVLGGCWMEESAAFRHEECPDGTPHPGGTLLHNGSPDGSEFAIYDVLADDEIPGEAFLTIWDAETLTVKERVSLGVVEGADLSESVLTDEVVVVHDLRRSSITIVDRASGEVTPVQLDGVQPGRLERDRALNRIWMDVNGGRVVLLDLDDFTVHQVSETIPGGIRGLSASPSGDRIAVGSTDDTLRVFSAEGDLLHEVPLTSPSDAWWLDGQRLMVGTADGPWAGVTLDAGELVEIAVGRIRRDFTPQECTFYHLPCAKETS